ncbi:cytidine and deoxycytidylate deaminase zinc-binding region [Colletotrichum tamarilloi]|uniref:dCMP deaminase n=1 Tax=Colletotrichum tamarilloi TaxID=1209934 RepID=A0ABQ9RKF4_9PEZI|nr:cytidine and deoxycytidylate deaminase zinc-binding region [Colletotrichum tamarilloi]KAI3546002.1 cytidine and deoxycytidylate deaminase zinc-binding region [Colletotrichum filicis]KAK1506295.1 cytidine and deoxycytidylate deaminase zinc-binding region [Colletotrichum tamarilloi]
MLIGICGGICAGKKSVAQYLVEHHGFRLLRLTDPAATPPRDEAPVSKPDPVPEPRPEPERADPQFTNGTNASGSQQQSSSKNKKKKNKGGASGSCFNCNEKGHTKAECPHPQWAPEGSIDTAVAISSNADREPKQQQQKPAFSPAPLTILSGQPRTNGIHSHYPNELVFSSADALLEYVTTRWQSRFVTTDVHNEAILDILSRRPFFMLISVDAPLTVRHARFRALHNPHCTLESFALASDTHLYDPKQGLQPLISRATVRLLNTSSSIAHLYATLGKLDLANPVRLRPTWDAYFMSLAELASLRSNCMKRRVGAVLVGREKRVISTGYNGTPRGLQNCSDGGCSRCNSGNSSGVGLATCLCIHAEENALLEAGRERIREGAVLYCDTCPCLTCSIKICQVGIDEVVYAHGYSMDTETAAVFRQAGVKLRQYIPPANGLIHLENLEKMELY